MSVFTRKLTRGARLRGVALVAGASVVVGTTLTSGSMATAAAVDTAAIYLVTQEGLTEQEGARLAELFGVPNALQDNGAFSYVDGERFNQVPQKRVGEGTDEDGRSTVSQAVDFAALDRIKPISEADAISRAAQLVDAAGLTSDFKAQPVASHSQLTINDQQGRVTTDRALDTAVSYQLSLGGLPAGGQGAKLRISFDGDGTVTQLSHSLRKLQRDREVAIISNDEARAACAALYGRDVRQNAPTLGYQLPPLAAEGASGKGRVQAIFPQYTCNPVTEQGTQAHRLVPAVSDATPKFTLTASLRTGQVEASASVTGGTGPYSYNWSSSTTVLDARDDSTVNYQRGARDGTAPERVTLEVTDVNGITATAFVELAGDGTGTSESTPGGGGFGELAVGPTDVGIEETIDEWQCAKDSGTGFKNVMQAHGVPVAFNWVGHNAWEKDFKDVTKGGLDNSYVDNVDAVWYTGHGWPGGFTFKGWHDDQTIVPSDARWGNRDLEWLQLESCSVLANPATWLQSFTGLHILNGFATTAFCIGGGTGGTFADYLFPKKFLWWTLRPAQTVRKAWASMALDKEPSGVKYRSMGLIRSDGVTNIGDYFWGQGPVGPDIPPASSIGYWTITGTV